MATVRRTHGNDRIVVGFALPDDVNPRTGAMDGQIPTSFAFSKK
jgi:hypothetical protein